MNSNRLRRAFTKAIKAAQKSEQMRGRVGRINADGSVSTVVAQRPAYLHVRLGAEGEIGSGIARNQGVPDKAGFPILLTREQGELVIVGPDWERVEAFYAGTGGAVVAKHDHRIGSGMEYTVEALRLEPGRVKWSSGLTVTIGAFAYPYAGALQYWPGGTIDLAANLPPTSGEWAWVLVGIDPATNTPVAVTGDDVPVATALDPATIAGIDFGGYIPCTAIKVRNDDTALGNINRYFDFRLWLDVVAGAPDSFLGLSDTPSDYTGSGGYAVLVNATEDALEFVDLSALYQPLDSDLVAIAGLATDAYGRGLLELANAAALRTYAGLVIGTDVQAFDADLAALAGLTSAADRLPYFTGSGTAALATFTGAARNLLDDATAGDMRTTLGLGTIATEPETSYLLLAGRSGGQTANGGTGAGDNLNLRSTSHGTKGKVVFGAAGTTVYDEVNERVGIGTDAPAVKLEVSTSGGSSVQRILSYGTGVESALSLYGPRGTAGTPAANQAGDILGSIHFGGWDTNLSIGARIQAVAAAEWGTSSDSTDNPTDLVIATVPDGSGTLTGVAKFTSTRRMMVGALGTANALIHAVAPSGGGTILAVSASGNAAGIAAHRPDSGWVRLHAGGGGSMLLFYENGTVFSITEAGAGSNPYDDTFAGTTTRLRVDTAGRVGLATVSPASRLHTFENSSAVDSSAGVTIEQNGSGDALMQYLLTGGQRWVAGIDNSDSDAYAISAAADLANKVFRLNSSGGMRHGSTPPPSGSANFLHWSHDGTAGWARLGVNISSGTAITLIANGTGDVTVYFRVLALIVPSGGATPVSAAASYAPSASADIYNVGGDTVNVAVAADGSVTIQRTAGTKTYAILLELQWL